MNSSSFLSSSHLALKICAHLDTSDNCSLSRHHMLFALQENSLNTLVRIYSMFTHRKDRQMDHILCKERIGWSDMPA